MDPAQFGQFSEITFEQFLSKSRQIVCKVIGTITSISKHKKYIIEVFLNKKSVIRSYKRYSEFQTLYQILSTKYPGYKIEEFPSKFQLFGKEETRQSYFQNLLNQIIKDYSKEEAPIEKELMQIVYNFLAMHINKQNQRRQSAILKKQKAKAQKQNRQITMNETTTGTDEKQNEKPTFQKKLLKQKSGERQRQRRSSVDISSPTVQIVRTRSNSVSQLMVEQPKKIIQELDNEYQIKFANQDAWKCGYLSVKGSGLYLYKSKMDNHFKTEIELYRIKIEYLKRKMNLFDHFCDKFQCNLTRSFNANEEILSIYHEYDKNKILIRKPVRETATVEKNQLSLQKLKQQIEQASHVYPKTPDFDGVFNPIGKLFVFIHHAKFNWRKTSQKDKIFFKVLTGAMTYHSMPITYVNEAQINQGFLIPISNTFERVRIECYTAKDINDKGVNIGFFKFSMIQFFTKPDRSLISKLEVSMIPYENKAEDYQTQLEISLQNLSDFTTIYSNSYASQYDGMPLEPITSIDDITHFQLAINRIFAAIGQISLFTRAFKRNVIKFKYPIMGYLFFSILLFNAVFLDVNYIIRQIILLLVLAIIYQEKHVNLIVNHALNQYVFSYIHEDFKNPQILSTGQIVDLKRSHQLRYIAEDYHYVDGKLQKTKKKRESYEFIVHNKMFVIKQQEQSFFQKMKEAKQIVELIYKILNTIAFSLQKISNLFCWIDVRKTVFITLLLFVMSGLASGTLIRIAIAGGCLAKMINGKSYYKNKHYQRNRKFAIYSLRYILHKSFPEIIGQKHIDENMDLFELNQYISDLKFPIHDESAQKKLRNEMSRIMGAHLQTEALLPKATKDNQLKLVHLLDNIETCETKLKVGLIAGQEGVTDAYQQLREETKQVQQLDDWLKESFINFVLNIPSKIFMIYHKKQLDKIEKAEIKQEIEEKGSIAILEQKRVQCPVIRSAYSIEAMQIQRRKSEMKQKNENSKLIVDQKVKKQQEARQKMVVLKQASLN